MRGESGKAGSEEGRWRPGDGRENFRGVGELQIGFSCGMSEVGGMCVGDVGRVCSKESVLQENDHIIPCLLQLWKMKYSFSLVA